MHRWRRGTGCGSFGVPLDDRRRKEADGGKEEGGMGPVSPYRSTGQAKHGMTEGGGN